MVSAKGFFFFCSKSIFLDKVLSSFQTIQLLNCSQLILPRLQTKRIKWNLPLKLSETTRPDEEKINLNNNELTATNILFPFLPFLLVISFNPLQKGQKFRMGFLPFFSFHRDFNYRVTSCPPPPPHPSFTPLPKYHCTSEKFQRQ